TELAKFIPYSINNLLIRSLLIDLIIFVCVSITLKIIRKILVSLLKSIGLGGINYLLGAVFGFIRGVFISAVFIIILEILHLDNSHSWQHSHFSGVIKPTIQILLSSLPNDLINFKDHANNYQNYYHLIKQVQH
ncbi:MAG: hypothetical protein RLZZ293_129, partial [Pseudomonadota bacterium]